MKFAIAKEHRDFFQKHGYIEFENLLTTDQLVNANQAVEEALALRLKIPKRELSYASPDLIYLQGRDLYRANPVLLKLVTQPRYAEIASELIEYKPLRLAYDQFLPTPQTNARMIEQDSLYQHFLAERLNLEEVSCVREVKCGLLVALLSGQDTKENEGAAIFPKRAGNGVFVRPDHPVDWGQLKTHMGERFYLIVYTQMRANYILQPHDPHTHFLKRLGYVFNDKLNDRLHPVVYR